MNCETLSQTMANWTTVVKNVAELSCVAILWQYLHRKQTERSDLCNRIGVKYYPCMTIVSKVRWEANKITQDSQGQLLVVKSLLDQFHFEIQRLPNSGTVEDVEIGEIRRMFSSEAATILDKIQDLIGKLDGLGKESWQDVCSCEVIECAGMILKEWEALLKILAHKRFMRVLTLKREYRELSEGV